MLAFENGTWGCIQWHVSSIWRYIFVGFWPGSRCGSVDGIILLARVVMQKRSVKTKVRKRLVTVAVGQKGEWRPIESEIGRGQIAG